MTPIENLLRCYGIAPSDLIGRGMEAEVYALDETRVLKLYSDTASFTNLQTLQSFYDGLDRPTLPFAVPQIERVIEYNDFVVTIEKWLRGTPMSAVLHRSNADAHQPLIECYIDATITLGSLRMPSTADRYKLFDAEHFSNRAQGDWHAFLRGWVRWQLTRVEPHLASTVADWSAKRDAILRTLAHPYVGPLALVHGDVFPGNFLVDQLSRVTALLDFGLFTMWGDPLWDVATACAFFDMYDELKANLRACCERATLARLGDVRDRLNTYVLVFSIISCDAYSHECSDGHCAWCVTNLNDDLLWHGIA